MPRQLQDIWLLSNRQRSLNLRRGRLQLVTILTSPLKVVNPGLEVFNSYSQTKVKVIAAALRAHWAFLYSVTILSLSFLSQSQDVYANSLSQKHQLSYPGTPRASAKKPLCITIYPCCQEQPHPKVFILSWEHHIATGKPMNPHELPPAEDTALRCQSSHKLMLLVSCLLISSCRSMEKMQCSVASMIFFPRSFYPSVCILNVGRQFWSFCKDGP